MTDLEANGRVTLALVQSDVRYLIGRVDDLTKRVVERQEEQEGRLRATESWCTKSAEKWEGHAETHRTERGIAAGAITLATAVASAIGISFKS
jgi:hypothetical protein